MEDKKILDYILIMFWMRSSQGTCTQCKWEINLHYDIITDTNLKCRFKKAVQMGQLMNDIIETAKSFTENFRDRANFDYSIESLVKVDALLDEMSDYVIDEDTLYNMYTMIGSYVFETSRRNYGGEYYWVQDEEQPILVIGEPDFSVAIKAWDKVKGRIENGEEDNIPFYIEGLKEHVEKGKLQKGYKALAV